MRLSGIDAIAILHSRFGARSRLQGNVLELMGSDVGCHPTANGTRPVHVKPAPEGGIIVTCFGCGQNKEAYRLLMGMLSDLVRPGHGPVQHHPPAPDPKMYHATPIEGPVTAADVVGMSLWVLHDRQAARLVHKRAVETSPGCEVRRLPTRPLRWGWCFAAAPGRDGPRGSDPPLESLGAGQQSDLHPGVESAGRCGTRDSPRGRP